MKLLLILAAVMFGDEFFVTRPVVLTPNPTPTPVPVVDGGFVVRPVKVAAASKAKVKITTKVVSRPAPYVIIDQPRRAAPGVPIGGVYPANRYNTMYHLNNPREAHASRIPRNADLNSLSDSQLTRLHDLLHAGHQVNWYQQQKCNGRTCSMYSYPYLD